MTFLLPVVVVAIGLIVGSFLNVVIYRVPRGASVVTPGSACPHCGVAIAPYDNVPVVSYLVLKGRCRACRGRIAVRYPLVEGAMGLLAGLLWWRFGPTVDLLIYFVFAALLLAIAVIDLYTQVIPNVLSLPGIVLGLAASPFLASVRPVEALIGAAAGGGFLYLIAWGYAALARREGMGMGDMKLLGMIGAFLGWKVLLPVIIISSVLGIIAFVGLAVARGWGLREPMPFGPFLVAAALVMLFVGPVPFFAW